MSVYPNKKQVLIAQIKFILYLFRKISEKYWKYLLTFCFIFLIIIIGFQAKNYFVYPQIPSTGFNEDSSMIQIRIPVGTSGKALMDTLDKRGVIKNPQWGRLLFRLFSFQNKIRAGIFSVPDTLNTWQVLEYLSKVPVMLRKVTIPEGLTLEKIGNILEHNGFGDAKIFDSLCHNIPFIRSLGINKVKSLEGYLLPDTYFFQCDESLQKIVSRMVAENNALFKTDSIQQQLKVLHFTRHQILTLASIIQGEIIYFDEAPLVSSVYHNRLSQGWRLQADPTIQYILEGPPKRLTYKDLKIDSPYNTYKYKGLPPGPINNPGRIAILAALYPARTSYYYFVATGDGRHHFSRTNRDHINWKKKFNRIRKKVYGK